MRISFSVNVHISDWLEQTENIENYREMVTDRQQTGLQSVLAINDNFKATDE